MWHRAMQAGAVTGLLLLGSGAAMFGYRTLRAELEAGVYRSRLEALTGEYEGLRERFNDAVERTAVTELVVKDGTLSVHVRTALGLVHEVQTPFDPTGEVYVDFVVLDGRLWIRRVFDARTPPGEGLVIDPDLARVEWDSGTRSPDTTAPASDTADTRELDLRRGSYGKAVYRRLDEGRWVVTVTGSGSLGLVKVEGDAQVPLAHAPAVRDYETMSREIEDRFSKIGPGDVWKRLVQGE